MTGFRKYLDVKAFVDFQIIQELVNNVDGYSFSTFFHKDKDSNGGKLHAGPLWDFDLCYGNEDYTDFNLATRHLALSEISGPIWWKNALVGTPDGRSKLQELYLLRGGKN